MPIVKLELELKAKSKTNPDDTEAIAVSGRRKYMRMRYAQVDIANETCVKRRKCSALEFQLSVSYLYEINFGTGLEVSSSSVFCVCFCIEHAVAPSLGCA